MLTLGLENPFRMMTYKYFELRRLRKINSNDEIFSFANIDGLGQLFEKMINELINSDMSEHIDLRYYRKLFDVENGKLKNHFIYHDDPFYPLYRHVENLLEDLSRLKEISIAEHNKKANNDTFVKSILSNRKLFLEDLNMSMCDKYSLKLVVCCDERFDLKKENRIKMNDIILQGIKSQQRFLTIHLSEDQRQLDEFVNVIMVFETLEMSFNQLCRNEDYGEIEIILPDIKNNDDYFEIENDNPLVQREKRSVDYNLMSNNYQNFIKKPTLRFLNNKKPQPLPIYQYFSSKNKSHRSLRDMSANEIVPVNSYDQLENVSDKNIDLYGSYRYPNYISSNGPGLCFFISLPMFFGVLLIILFKKMF
ncbi:hypothetical protein NBO_8g0023 [Nosema bombycis CQ1]|uniref:Uncharacterized protein n=1 Tax=Nosema bombycis (strain CQ1 / CVCC 102059) TaxID=578461 RepID=R0MQJ2_NOSB1|nr:hypothetical protein NBO_8g0023 [Nosema bombycis CQ1]|eukprot:EOB15158.1 hypothetical protein NBO_8g0023 [Nosema bombycis CQ1]